MKLVDNLVMTVAAALAVAVAVLGIDVGVKRAEIAGLQAAVDQAAADRDGWATGLASAIEGLKACQAQWATAQTAADVVRDEARKWREDAERKQAEWTERWDARSNTCSAALDAMETACATEIGEF